MERRKVTTIGSGNVGATVAQRIVDREMANVALIDIVEGVPQGEEEAQLRKSASAVRELLDISKV
jgi:malate dehydrogenase